MVDVGVDVVFVVIFSYYKGGMYNRVLISYFIKVLFKLYRLFFLLL